MTKALTLDEARVGCEDCGRPYGDQHGFPDLVIPHHVWERISTNGDGSGLLCPSCICARLHKAGITCEGAFMSGPINSVPSPMMTALCSIETLKRAIARQEIAALSDGDRTRAEDARVGGTERTSSKVAHDLGWLRGQLAKVQDKTWVPLPVTPEGYGVLDVMQEAIEALRSRDATIAGHVRRIADLERGMEAAADDCKFLAERNAKLEAVLRAYEQWEADLIVDDRAWTVETGAFIPQDMYDRFIEIQGQRNAALKEASS